MLLLKIDPRALKPNPNSARRSPTSAQADALLLATIKAVGIVQPPIVAAEADGSNSYIINAGHRRVAQAIAAGLEEIEVLVDETADDTGAMRNMVENIARETLNPVDQWRAIERLVALGWTEEAIAIALGLPVRQIRKLRLLANMLPVMLDHMANGDMPNEQQLRTIAAAPIEEQGEAWVKHEPKKGQRDVTWWSLANALEKRKMYARDASFDDALATAYGIAWVEDLFAPAGEDSRYTVDVEAFLGAQHEWMATHLPKRGTVVETTQWGEPKLPPKAERVYGKPARGDCTGVYLDRNGKVQSVAYRMPAAKPKGKPEGSNTDSVGADATETIAATPTPRADVTQRGIDMIGDFRTDALHEALARAPIEDDMLMALLVLALAGNNVSIASGASSDGYVHGRMQRHAAKLVDGRGQLVCDRDTLRIAARSALIDTLSSRRNRTDSGIVARIAGSAIGADNFLVQMGTEEFLSCLSRQALERACQGTPVVARQRQKETRAALVEHFVDGRFVHLQALFAPDPADVATWRQNSADADTVDEDGVVNEQGDTIDDTAELDVGDEASPDEELENGWRVAAE
jgi:ParB family chromosome partitioning protein